MAVQLPEGMGADDVRAAVRDRYGHVAAALDAGFNFPAGRAFAEAVGYPAALLDSLPPDAAGAFAGVGCPAGWTAGRAIGLDFAPAMIERAMRAIAAATRPRECGERWMSKRCADS